MIFGSVKYKNLFVAIIGRAGQPIDFLSSKDNAQKQMNTVQLWGMVRKMSNDFSPYQGKFQAL